MNEKHLYYFIYISNKKNNKNCKERRQTLGGLTILKKKTKTHHSISILNIFVKKKKIDTDRFIIE